MEPETDDDRPRLGVLLRLGVVLLILALGAGGVLLVRIATAPDPARASVHADLTGGIPVADVRPGSLTPVDAAVDAAAQPQPRAAAGPDPLRTWAQRLAVPAEVPARALMAYGNAELALRTENPGCHLSWTTLAAIGRVESDHGRYGGATLGEDGRPSRPIIGVPLDGSPGVRAIGDTDGGRFDGDPDVDRAVGPMQFIPSTWSRWAADADLDGVGDPHQIDDAALAAGRYLCANGRDLAIPADWWAAVLSYNNSVTYGQKVFGLADGYGRTAR
ncbi:murein transglycosylase [Actinophytocola xinjiangensis]|uniref:Murein transglycosylase n=1 Tax=Actinophytocola xinjiangensis TaxID=485602 RepID=A0A7Z1AUC7_9PSEU|nr:murein transglycosylase [Actinophytocola xinjiangensis]